MNEDENQVEKPVSKRRQNRIAAMQFLYLLEMNAPEDLTEAMRVFFESQEQGREYYAFAEEMIHAYWDVREEIDVTIKEKAANWSFQRIAKVDLAILRLAIYELLYRDDIPPVVSINEAIDLAKEFSDVNSRRFVNGILDEVKKQLKRPLREALQPDSEDNA